jgi:hypothetical protein
MYEEEKVSEIRNGNKKQKELPVFSQRQLWR